MNKVVKGNVNVFDIAGNIEEGFNMNFLKDIKIGVTKEEYCEYQLLKEENEKLKKMVNFGGITIVNCPECNKEINVNFCRETEEYRKKYENAVADYEYEKSKNQRAIEYIENTYIGSILEVHCGEEEEYTKPLLEILKGNNNEL